MQLFAWLMLAVWPLARHVLVSLGIGWVTYEGLGVLMSGLQNSVLQAWGNVSGEILSILTLSGFAEALGITLGALSARVALMSFARLGRVTQ